MAAKELMQYIMEQLSGLGEIRTIPMMGGYIFYYRERIFGGIYGNGFLVKDTKAGRRHMPDSEPQPPYEGAKDHYLLDPDDRDTLREAVRRAEEVTPLPRKRMKKEGSKG